MIAFIVCLAYIASIFAVVVILVATSTSLYAPKSKVWGYLLVGALVFHFICVGGVIIILSMEKLQ